MLAECPKFLDHELVEDERLRSLASAEPCILGIDEAGRGPVLGPMVYACAITPLSKTNALKQLGVNDSKVLSEEDRSKIFSKIRDSGTGDTADISYALLIISPKHISTQMNKRIKQSLNKISHDAAIRLIHHALDSGINVKKVFVDTVGPKAAYKEILMTNFPAISEITVEERADSTYPIVSAASIVAKVTRDKCVAEWKFEEAGLSATSLGSGYPGDPATKKALAKLIDPVFGFPSVVRFSWKTAENILDKSAFKSEWSSDQTFKGESLKELWNLSGKFKRHAFLSDRGFSNMIEF